MLKKLFQSSVAKYYETRELFPEVEYTGFEITQKFQKDNFAVELETMEEIKTKIILQEGKKYHLRLAEKNDAHPKNEFKCLGLGRK